MLSNDQGEYVIADVVPDAYFLRVSKDGYAVVFYGSHGSGFAPREYLDLKAGDKRTGIDVQMSPGGSITGLVLDSAGQPVPLSAVSLFRAGREGPERQAIPTGGTKADEEGRYQLPGLEPDTYYVAAHPPEPPTRRGNPPAENARRTVYAYYPSEPNLASAAPVYVSKGQQVGGVDVKLRDVESYVVRGHIEGGMGFHAYIWPSGVSVWSVMPRGVSIDTADGLFEFVGVEPGGYEVIATNSTGFSYARVHVDVRDTDIEDIRVAAGRTPSVTGVVVVEGDKGSVRDERIAIGLSPVEMLPMRQTAAWSDEDGKFQIARVVPGRYNVSIPRLPEGALLKRLQWGGSEVQSHQVEVGADESRTLQAVIAFDGGSETGFVTDSSGRPVEKAIVVTLPDGHGEPGELYYELTDSSGEFLERNLRPGRYLVMAFEDIDPRQLERNKLAAFTGLAERVQIEPGRRAMVRLRAMPAPGK